MANLAVKHAPAKEVPLADSPAAEELMSDISLLTPPLFLAASVLLIEFISLFYLLIGQWLEKKAGSDKHKHDHETAKPSAHEARLLGGATELLRESGHRDALGAPAPPRRTAVGQTPPVWQRWPGGAQIR